MKSFAVTAALMNLVMAQPDSTGLLQMRTLTNLSMKVQNNVQTKSRSCDGVDAMSGLPTDWLSECRDLSLVVVDAMITSAEAAEEQAATSLRSKKATYDALFLAQKAELIQAAELNASANAMDQQVKYFEGLVSVQAAKVATRQEEYEQALVDQSKAEVAFGVAATAEAVATQATVEVERDLAVLHETLENKKMILEAKELAKTEDENDVSAAEAAVATATEKRNQVCDHASKKRGEADDQTIVHQQAAALLDQTQATLEDARADHAAAVAAHDAAKGETEEAVGNLGDADDTKKMECAKAREDKELLGSANQDYNNKAQECSGLKQEKDAAKAAKDAAKTALDAAKVEFTTASSAFSASEAALKEAEGRVEDANERLTEAQAELVDAQDTENEEREESMAAKAKMDDMQDQVDAATGAETTARTNSRVADDNREKMKGIETEECEKAKNQRATATKARAQEKNDLKAKEEAITAHGEQTKVEEDASTDLQSKETDLSVKTDNADTANTTLTEKEKNLLDAEAAEQRATEDKSAARGKKTRKESVEASEGRKQQTLVDVLNTSVRRTEDARTEFDKAAGLLEAAENLAKLCELQFDLAETENADKVERALDSATVNLVGAKEAYENTRSHLQNMTAKEDTARAEKEAQDLVYDAANQELQDATEDFEKKSLVLEQATKDANFAQDEVTDATFEKTKADKARDDAEEARDDAHAVLVAASDLLEKKRTDMETKTTNHAEADKIAGEEEDSADKQEGICSKATTDREGADDEQKLANGEWTRAKADLANKNQALAKLTDIHETQKREWGDAQKEREAAASVESAAAKDLAQKQGVRDAAKKRRDDKKAVFEAKQANRANKQQTFEDASTKFDEAKTAHDTCTEEEAVMLDVLNNARSDNATQNTQCQNAIGEWKNRKGELAAKESAESQREDERDDAEANDDMWTSFEEGNISDTQTQLGHKNAKIADAEAAEAACEARKVRLATREDELNKANDDLVESERLRGEAEAARDDAQRAFDDRLEEGKRLQAVRKEKYFETVTAMSDLMAKGSCVESALQQLRSEEFNLSGMKQYLLGNAIATATKYRTNAKLHEKAAKQLEPMVAMYKSWFVAAEADHQRALVNLNQKECLKINCGQYWGCNKPTDIPGLLSPSHVMNGEVYDGQCENDQAFKFCKEGACGDITEVKCIEGQLYPVPYCEAALDTKVTGILKYYAKKTDLPAGFELQVVRGGFINPCNFDAGKYGGGCWDMSSMGFPGERMIRISMLNHGVAIPIKTSFKSYVDPAYENKMDWAENVAVLDISRGTPCMPHTAVVEPADDEAFVPLNVQYSFATTDCMYR